MVRKIRSRTPLVTTTECVRRARMASCACGTRSQFPFFDSVVFSSTLKTSLYPALSVIKTRSSVVSRLTRSFSDVVLKAAALPRGSCLPVSVSALPRHAARCFGLASASTVMTRLRDSNALAFTVRSNAAVVPMFHDMIQCHKSRV